MNRWQQQERDSLTERVSNHEINTPSESNGFVSARVLIEHDDIG